MHWNDLIGRRIGPYEIIEELGRGGTARVYRAYQESMNRYVAIKVLINPAEDRLGFVQRFEREVEVVAQLNHPNIVAVYDAGEVEELIYLVMQCVNGGTFRQRLGQPMPTDEACAAMIQMAQALHHAHTRGVVHRDVKPSNMLIDANDGHLLLTDFGIAKLHGMRGLTKSGTTVGTPEYMAPEQAESGETDARADVYSLGCVLYEALSGRPPFIGTSPVSVLYQQVHTRPDYIRGLNPKVPRELAHVIEIALAKRPDDRFPTAESFALALRSFAAADARPQAAVPAPAPTQPADPAPSTDPPPPAAPSSLDVPAAGPPLTPLALGAEGLDALFPDDPEAIAARAAQPGYDHAADTPPWANLPPGADTLPPPRPAAHTTTAGPRSTIPLPAFRLPSRDTITRPLDLPLTPDGLLDVEALMSQVEEHPTIPMLLPPPTYHEFGDDPELSGDGASPIAARRKRDPITEHSLSELRAALTAPPALRGTSPPIWRPDPETDAKPRRTRLRAGRLKARRDLVAMTLVTVLAVSLIASAILLAAGAGPASRKPAPTPTTSLPPTATVIPSSTATATPTQQQILDQRARAAFKAITLASRSDSSCSNANSKTTFGAGASIYVNLCVARSAPSGQMTVVIRRGGATVAQLTRDTRVYAGYWYSYYTYGLSPATYDALVTYNGGTAADLVFTVS
jgi:serine/threonine protein kinase